MSQFVLILAALFIFTGCQVKEENGNGQLIAGHRPADNSFSVSLPSNGSYKETQTLNFILTHPYNVDVVGTPRIALTIGGSSVYANYASGSGTKNLTFSYTIQPGDNDSDGIAVASVIDLPGGATIQFNAGTDVSTAITTGSTSLIRVDTTTPTILSATAPPAVHYYTGQTFLFSVTYSEPVVVSGVPSIDFTLNQCETPVTRVKKANYISGSGSATLVFAYTIENHCNDVNGIPLTTAIQLNSGTITDAAGNIAATDASAALPATITSATQIRGRYPLISNISPPPNGTYIPGNTLDYLVTFDRPVTVTGTTAYINMTVGVITTRQAQFFDQPTTTTARFRYTVIGGDVDSDGVVLSNEIINENTICATGYCLVNTVTDRFTPPLTPGVIVNAPIPSILGIQLPSPLPTSGWFKLADSVQVVVRFSEIVNVTGGTPILHAVVGAANKTFTYLSGSGTANLIFQYNVTAPDFDSDGVNFTGPLDLNGALIQNASGTNASMDFTFTINPGFRFDGIIPTITGSSLVANAPSTTDYRLGHQILIDISFSEIVTVGGGGAIGLTINGVNRNAVVVSGNGTTTVRFGYTVVAADATLGQASTLTIPTTITGGTIRDVALNDIVVRTFPTIPTVGIDVDGAIPTVTASYTLPTNGTYKFGDTISITANFSEPVVVSGTPTWNITLASGGPGVATYISGSGTSAILFQYTVGTDHLDTDGIVFTNSFSGGSFSDLSVGNPMAATFTPPTAASTIGIRVDGTTPTVLSISGTAGTFDQNQYVTMTVLYSEAVTVVGSPQLVLDVAGQTKYADFTSGSGSSSIVYRYQVEASLQDTNGVQVTGHIENSGTIRDTAGNDAVLTVTTQNFPSVLVDSKAPTLLSVTVPTPGVRVTGNTLSFIANYDEDVWVNTNVLTTIPTISLNIGGQTIEAAYVSGSGTMALTFTTPAMTANEFDMDGISFNSGTISLNMGTIRDSLAHTAVNTFTGPSMSDVKVIYSAVRSWLNMGTTSGGTIASVTSSSPAGVNGIAAGGTVIRNPGDADFQSETSAGMSAGSYLNISSVSNVKTIFVVFRADALPASNELVSDGINGIILDNFDDLSFGSNASLSVNNGAFGASATSCTSCYNGAVTNILGIDFDSTHTMSGIRVGNFTGRVAEVWILDDSQSLTNAQKLKISNYLSLKY